MSAPNDVRPTAQGDTTASDGAEAPTRPRLRIEVPNLVAGAYPCQSRCMCDPEGQWCCNEGWIGHY